MHYYNVIILVSFLIKILTTQVTDNLFKENDNNQIFQDGKIEFKEKPLLNRKIFQGYRVSKAEHPYVVSIRRQVSHYVTGVMLTNSLILTVAQPVFGVSIEELGVVVGENYCDRGLAVKQVVLIVIHESYDPYTLRGNLAMLKIFHKVVQTVSSKPIWIINQTSEGNTAFVTGWGRCDWTGKELCLARSSIYHRNEIFDPMLRTISFTVKESNPQCDSYNLVGYRKAEGEICFGPEIVAEIPCPCMGVPGAPLVIGGHLRGLQSWGYACNYENCFPVVYIDLYYYKNWIAQNMKIFDDIKQETLKPLYILTRSYLMWQWLNKTRKFKPVLRQNSNIINSLAIDKHLIRLEGKLYDIRDTIYNNKYHLVKQAKLQYFKAELERIGKLKNIYAELNELDLSPFIRPDSNLEIIENENETESQGHSFVTNEYQGPDSTDVDIVTAKYDETEFQHVASVTNEYPGPDSPDTDIVTVQYEETELQDVTTVTNKYSGPDSPDNDIVTAQYDETELQDVASVTYKYAGPDSPDTNIVAAQYDETELQDVTSVTNEYPGPDSPDTDIVTAQYDETELQDVSSVTNKYSGPDSPNTNIVTAQYDETELQSHSFVTNEYPRLDSHETDIIAAQYDETELQDVASITNKYPGSDNYDTHDIVTAQHNYV